MNKEKLEESLGVVFAVLFISIIVVLVFMKYSENCGLFGSSFERVVGNYLCPESSKLASMVDEQEADDAGDTADVDGIEEVERSEQAKVIVKDAELAEDGAANTSANVKEDKSAEKIAEQEKAMPATAAVPTAAVPSSVETNGDGSANKVGGSDAMQSETAADTTAGETAAIQPVIEPLPPSYETPALLVADNKLKLTSLMPAKVSSIGFKDGQEFKKGDVLVLFDCKDLELDIDFQKEVLKEKEASVRNFKDLHEVKSTSDFSIIQAESQLGQTEKMIEKLENQAKNCIIKAEYSGKIIKKSVTENEYLVAGQEIMTVNNNEELLVKAYVPVAWIGWLDVGSSFKLCINDNDCYKGVVNRMGAEVDAISQTLDIFGKLTGKTNPKLIAGISGQVTFDKT